ncbi:hypothetical protein [Allopontixanthobacter sediminis]|uniref:Uncharacterized protein n=1 Tax=Allopontixanthobacter sediminis TaxID=1689985 RepID=A0A845AZM4_9SPHN|nr:hypothetical protein [Allopontixanthobacter sediminis]MXP43408.1 hypothetical protein [Allopontixanthobacter sediminis]
MVLKIPKEQIRIELKRMVDQARDTLHMDMERADAEIRSAVSLDVPESCLVTWNNKLADKKVEADAAFAQFHQFIDEA